MIEVTRTYDAELIKSILFDPDLWDAIAEDGQKKDEFEPVVNDECWLLMTHDETVIALYNYHTKNAITVEIHAHVLPGHRKKFSKATGEAALRWLIVTNPQYQKVVAQIPHIYQNVLDFACSFGFMIEGINRLSYLKNGEIVDQWMLGITREEIEAVLNEQIS